MCGLVGIASRLPVENRVWLAIGRDAIRHRGPDDAGEWWSSDGRVGLGHRRLSILDLSLAGHQPMRSDAHGLIIVFNGEIYNFRELRTELEQNGYAFQSSSDTEVLLSAYDAWGVDCLSHLNGMFAFALYDQRRQVLFIARDRAGEKPLFYHQEQGTLRFASELKALLADPCLVRRIDAQSLDCYLAMGYIPGDKCILSGFNKLPPAHAMTFDLMTGKSNIWRYWHLPKLSPNSSDGQVDETALVDRLEELLEDAVRKQLVADVPVGILLSGGVDSSLITAMAVRASRQVNTFTIRFPGHGALDETEHARLISRHFETTHTELIAEPTTADLLPSLARQFDEPMADSSMIPTFLVSQLVQKRCTVALGGDGGDELFGGYSHHSRLLWMQRQLGYIPRSLRRIVSSGAEHILPVGYKGRNWLQGLGTDLRKGLPLIATYFDASIRRRLLNHVTNYELVAESVRMARIPDNDDLLQRATRLDFSDYLAEDILVKVDRSSMLNSLEVRAPLLDYRIIEFAFGMVPSNLKATPLKKKVLLKRLAARLLPPEFDRQRKQGFSIPLAEWLKGGAFRDMFHAVLLDKSSLFDQTAVRGLLKGQAQGRSNAERLFSLVLFELWRREYSVSL